MKGYSKINEKIIMFAVSLICLVSICFMSFFDLIAFAGNKSTKVERMDYLLHMGDVWAMQIRFDISISDIDIEGVKDDDYIKDYIEFNGVKIRDLLNAKDENGKVIENPVQVHFMQNATDKYRVIHIFLSDKIPETAGGVQSESPNILKVLSGFITHNGYKVNETEEFINKGAGWIKKIDTSGIEWESLELLSISAPKVDIYENVTFTFSFDTPISLKSFFHFNADPTWLLAVSSQENAPFYYSVEELQVMQSYEIIDSFMECIEFNGESLFALMKKETEAAYKPVTVMLHLGGNGDFTTMDLTFSSFKTLADNTIVDGANKINNIDQEFVIKLKKGLKTPSLRKTSEEFEFKYNVLNKKFFRQNAGGLSNNANIGSIFYNGFELKENETLFIKNTTKLDLKLLTVELEDKDCEYEVQNYLNLKSGNNVVTIKATATDGTTKNFIFNVNIENLKGCNKNNSKNLMNIMYISTFMFSALLLKGIKR